jgi:hypothetical protein
MTAPPIADDPLPPLLARERAAFLAALERVPAARRAERAAPDRWSALEIAEHVARIDVGVAKLLALKGAEPVTSTPAEREAARLTPQRAALVRDRSVRVEAPDRVRPTGALDEPAVQAQLAAARAAFLQAYQAADPAVLDGALHPHPFIGPVTLRGWVELAAHHDARHAQQLDEIAGA